MNGRKQVEQYARLVNSEQKAPASAAWTPDQLGGYRVGDMVTLPSIDAPLRVVELADPLLILESPSGHRLKAGWASCRKVRTRAEIGGQS